MLLDVMCVFVSKFKFKGCDSEVLECEKIVFLVVLWLCYYIQLNDDRRVYISFLCYILLIWQYLYNNLVYNIGIYRQFDIELIK